MTRAMAKYVAEIAARTVLNDLNYCVNHQSVQEELIADVAAIRQCLFKALLQFPVEMDEVMDTAWRSPISAAWNELDKARHFRPICPMHIANAHAIITAINARIATN